MEIKQLSFKYMLKKHYWLMILLALAGIMLLVNAIPMAYASVTDHERVINEFNAFLAGFGVTGFSKMTEAYDTFNGFLRDDGGLSSQICGFTAGIASALVVIYTLINVIKESMRGEIDMDYWFKIFASAAIAVLLVTSTNTVMNSLYGLGDHVVQSVETNLRAAVTSGDGYASGSHNLETETQYIPNNTSSTAYKKLMIALKQIPGMEDVEEIVGSDQALADSMWYKMQSVSEMLKILQYVVYLPLIICVFLLFSAVFELKIRQLFAPIAVASIAYEGGRSAGVRYLKKYLGCFIKIAIYFSIAAIGSMLTYYFFRQMVYGPDSDTAIFMNMLMMLGSNIVAGLSMMQSGGLGDEIVGI